MKLKYFYVVFSLLSIGLIPKIYAQDDVLNNAKMAFRVGNPKDLSRHFSNLIDLKIDAPANGLPASNSNYSKIQAEFILKDFFKQNPPEDFEYIYEGTSKEGGKYTIGKYKYRNKDTNKAGVFRVLLKIKLYNREYLIDEIYFSRETDIN